MNDMTELLTAAQMRAIERAAIESGEVTGLELMERAGRGTVEAILEEWPELREGERRAVVLCGPGNNGGDGFVVARLLKERGWAVEVFLYGDPERLPPDARVNWERWGPEVRSLIDAEFATFPHTEEEPSDWGPVDIVADALFGAGLSRPVEGLGHVLDNLNFAAVAWSTGTAGAPRVIALDLVTELDGNSGRLLGYPMDRNPLDECAAANLTVTFHRPFIGHFLADGPLVTGRLVIVDIGLGPPEADSPSSAGDLSTGAAEGVCRLTVLDQANASGEPAAGTGVLLSKYAASHKYHHGHALVLSGGVGRGGAARMAARGALRIGAGLVTLGCPPAALQENASRVDAVMTRAVKGAAGLAAMLEDERLNALALGPGLGTGKEQAALVRVALGGATDRSAPGSPRGLERPGEAEGDRGPGSGAAASGEGGGRSEEGPPSGKGGSRRAVVLDADALTILAGEPDLFVLLHDRCVLTPHPGEFARLFPDIAERLAAPAEAGPAFSKVDATREAAARAGCVVLHKGPDTVIAHPDGRAAINSAHYERSAPWLATAGAGDVLTGFIAGLLARGLGPMQAAEAAAWLHVECALEFGPGLIAEDLPEQLPRVFRRLGI